MFAHWATTSLHRPWSATIASASSHLMLILCRSFLNVWYHVFFGLPCSLLPAVSNHCIAVFAWQWLGIRNTWPVSCSCCSVTMSCNFHNFPCKILQKQRCLNTLSLCLTGIYRGCDNNCIDQLDFQLEVDHCWWPDLFWRTLQALPIL